MLNLRMPKYVPILKAKRPQCWAWKTARSTVTQNGWPVFELVPAKRFTVKQFAERIADMWDDNGVLAVDAAALCRTQEPNDTGGPVDQAARALWQLGLRCKPVMHLTDNTGILADVGTAAKLHQRGACLRLGTSTSDPDATEADAKLASILTAANLPIEEVDLLLDFAAIRSSRDVKRVVPIGESVVEWAKQTGSWRSIIVASGAFPPTSYFSAVRKNSVCTLRRHDADLYESVAAQFSGIELDYGDYAVWPPELPSQSGGGNEAVPYLRYTYEREWHVHRGDNDKTVLNGKMQDVCARIVKSSHWLGPGYSRGDAEIDKCAQGGHNPGRPEDWSQWAASHHLAHVVDRLSIQGEP